jgi:hypothetical protein
MNAHCNKPHNRIWARDAGPDRSAPAPSLLLHHRLLDKDRVLTTCGGSQIFLIIKADWGQSGPAVPNVRDLPLATACRSDASVVQSDGKPTEVGDDEDMACW